MLDLGVLQLTKTYYILLDDLVYIPAPRRPHLITTSYSATPKPHGVGLHSKLKYPETTIYDFRIRE